MLVDREPEIANTKNINLNDCAGFRQGMWDRKKEGGREWASERANECETVFFVGWNCCWFCVLSGIFLMLLFATPSVKDTPIEYRERKIIHKCAFGCDDVDSYADNLRINLCIYVLLLLYRKSKRIWFWPLWINKLIPLNICCGGFWSLCLACPQHALINGPVELVRFQFLCLDLKIRDFNVTKVEKKTQFHSIEIVKLIVKRLIFV